MNYIKYLWFRFKLRKETKYILSTWKIPLCSCKEYFKQWKCKHTNNIKDYFNNLINNG